MLRKIFKSGHSFAFTVPRQLLVELGLKLGDSVKMEVDQDASRLVVRPAGRQNQLALGLHSRTKLGSKIGK